MPAWKTSVSLGASFGLRKGYDLRDYAAKFSTSVQPVCVAVSGAIVVDTQMRTFVVPKALLIFGRSFILAACVTALNDFTWFTDTVWTIV